MGISKSQEVDPGTLWVKLPVAVGADSLQSKSKGKASP